MAHAYLTDSNRGMTATDTQKNTVYYIAKKMSSECSPEEFAIALAKHFVNEYPLVSKAKVLVKVKPWERYRDVQNEQCHDHGFVMRGSEIRTAYVTYGCDDRSKDAVLTVEAGMMDCKVLKTTQSGYAGFLHDAFTLLPDTDERIVATSMKSTWKYCSKSLPRDYDATYALVRDTSLATFFGPAKGGVFSPSVQYTLYQMAKAVIERYVSLFDKW